MGVASIHPKQLINISKTQIAGLDIGKSLTGNTYPPLVVAEISANHNGCLDTMLKTIETAVQCGADAIKIQTYDPDTLTIKTDNPAFRINKGKWQGQYLYDLYTKARTPYEWHPKIFEWCKTLKVPCFSTPFTPQDVDFLERFNPPAYKIASFEITDVNLIEYASSKGKPVIISTGTAEHDDLVLAQKYFRSPTILLHCISEYPARVDQMNIRRMLYLNRFSKMVGLSDHSLSNIPAIIATGLGACIIEKHFTLSRDIKSEDAEFSIEPDEFFKLTEDIVDAWAATSGSWVEPNKALNRSIYATKYIAAGEKLTHRNIASVRPSGGLHPRELPDLLANYIARHDIIPGTPLDWAKVKTK